MKYEFIIQNYEFIIQHSIIYELIIMNSELTPAETAHQNGSGRRRTSGPPRAGRRSAGPAAAAALLPGLRAARPLRQLVPKYVKHINGTAQTHFLQGGSRESCHHQEAERAAAPEGGRREQAPRGDSAAHCEPQRPDGAGSFA